LSKLQKKTELNQALTEQLLELREKEDNLEIEAHGWAEKRDKLNEQTSSLRTDVFELRSQRDKLNSDVKEMKEYRDSTTAKIHEKIEETRRLLEENNILAKKKPSRSHEELKKEVERIDWTIQTTPLTVQKDKELVEQVRKLEVQITVHKKIENTTKKIAQLRTEINTMKAENEVLHKDLKEKAQKSQETHKRMLEKIEESKALKTEADNAHKQYLLAKERTKSVKTEINAVLKQIRQLKDEVHEEEERGKKKRQDALRETLEKQAQEKLKRGEKLSWEEFQLLAEKGMADQDSD
jgi:uncharacterized coiled-coil DUF342 family protein